MLRRKLPTPLVEPPRQPEFFKILKPLDLLLGPHPRPLAVRLEALVADHPIQARPPLKRAVDLGPVLAFDDPLAREQDLAFGAWPELALEDLLAQLADAPANVVTVEREHTSILPHAPDEQVDVRVVGVVVIDRDPFEPCIEIAFHSRHHLAHVGAQIDPLGVLGRHDERPHQLVAAFPLPHYRRHLEPLAPGVKALAPLGLALRALTGQIARVPHPRPFAPIAPERRLNDTPPPVNPRGGNPPPASTTGAGLWLPARRGRRLGPAHRADPPEPHPPRAARLARLEPPEPQPGLFIPTRRPRQPHRPPSPTNSSGSPPTSPNLPAPRPQAPRSGASFARSTASANTARASAATTSTPAWPSPAHQVSRAPARPPAPAARA